MEYNGLHIKRSIFTIYSSNFLRIYIIIDNRAKKEKIWLVYAESISF